VLERGLQSRAVSTVGDPMRLAVVLVPLLLAACVSDAEPEVTVAQLEAPSATHDFEEPREALTVSGTSAVSGADRDWTVVVADPRADVTVDLHLPGGSDLSVLDGRALTVDVTESWMGPATAFSIRDEAGLALIVQTWSGGTAAEAFGADFVSFGAALGEGVVDSAEGDWTLRYHEVHFETDGGPVDTRPGEPFEAELGGERWRIVVLGAFEVVDMPATLPGCGSGFGDTLAFEMQRLEREPILDVREALADERRIGESSCGG
jgi:hypothetical protein